MKFNKVIKIRMEDYLLVQHMEANHVVEAALKRAVGANHVDIGFDHITIDEERIKMSEDLLHWVNAVMEGINCCLPSIYYDEEAEEIILFDDQRDQNTKDFLQASVESWKESFEQDSKMSEEKLKQLTTMQREFNEDKVDIRKLWMAKLDSLTATERMLRTKQFMFDAQNELDLYLLWEKTEDIRWRFKKQS